MKIDRIFVFHFEIRYTICIDNSVADFLMLNIQDFLSVTNSVVEMISYLQKRLTKELMKEYPGVIDEDESILSFALEDVYRQTKDGFIFIIDEWDCILFYGIVDIPQMIRKNIWILSEIY